MFFWANVYRHAVRLLSRACYSYFTWLTGVKVCATVAGTVYEEVSRANASTFVTCRERDVSDARLSSNASWT